MFDEQSIQNWAKLGTSDKREGEKYLQRQQD